MFSIYALGEKLVYERNALALKLEDRWIWDSWYVWDGDVCHAFYLCASKGLGDPERRHRYTNVGHATSLDLENWTILPDALSPSDSPAFDSWTTWTGSTLQGPDGIWWMFYAGTSREDGGHIQKIGAATSSDLITWEKQTDILIEADSRWYEKLADAEPGSEMWEAWRDPWVYWSDENSRWEMLITARSKFGESSQRGVMGLAISDDMRKWEVLEPLTKPGQGFGHLEVFQHEVVDGVPILLFCCGLNELSQEQKVKSGYQSATFSVVTDRTYKDLDFSKSKAFLSTRVYAGRLVQKPSGQWYLLGFWDQVDGAFLGHISDPIPVSATMKDGLIPAA